MVSGPPGNPVTRGPSSDQSPFHTQGKDKHAMTTSIAKNIAATLTSRAVLFDLTIKLPSFARGEKQYADEIAAAHGAAKDWGRYTKYLIDMKAIKPLSQCRDAAKADYYRMTAPWFDGGGRIILSTGYANLIDTMRRHETEYYKLRGDLIPRYPSLVNDARVALNGMFRESDYPTIEELEYRISFSTRMLPVPSRKHLIVDIAEYELDKARRDLDADTQANIRVAMADVIDRIKDAVSKMASTLRTYAPRTGDVKAQSIFRDSLVENVRSLCDVIPSLNLTGDPRIDAIADTMSATLCAVSADGLRASEPTRLTVADQADDILKQVAELDAAMGEWI